MEKFDLIEQAQKKIIICAHRGVWGGNIPCNTALSYDIALQQGADMIELDVTASADGELFVFHPGKEAQQLNLYDVDIRKLPAAEIKKLRYTNLDGFKTQEPIYLLDDILEHLKKKCFINVDKFGDNPAAIIQKIKKHNIADQIILKSVLKPQVLDMMEAYASDLQYLAIVETESNPHEELMHRNLNYVGLEVVFKDENSPLMSEAFRNKVHADGKLLWGNAILFNYRRLLAASHCDDVALRGNPDLGWGFFAREGFDIIQTDWPLALSNYLEKTNQRYR